MIEQISRKTAILLVDKLPNLDHIKHILHTDELEKEDCIEVVSYALEGVYGEIAKSIIVYGLAYKLNILLPTLLISLVFSTLRSRAGGVHMDTWLKCLIATALMFLLVAYSINIMSELNIQLNIIVLMVSFLGGIVLIKLYAPRDTPNKPIIDEQEISKFKIKSLKYIVYIHTITFLLILVNYISTNDVINVVIFSIFGGVWLELFTTTPIGVKIFNTFDEIF